MKTVKTSDKAVLGATVVGLMVLGIVYLHSKLENTQQTSPVAPSPICEPIKDNRSEVVGNWIMRHSSQISDATARQIAEEVFKVPNPILMISLMEVESLFVPSAVSKVGAVGLGQIMFEVHKKALAEIGISKKRDLFNIDCNIKASSLILQDMIKRSSGDLTKALHLYLGGKDGKYVARIFSNYIHLSIEIENALPKV